MVQCRYSSRGLHGAMMVAADDSRIENLAMDIKKSLLQLGLNLGGYGIDSFERLARKEYTTPAEK
jgi:hypothetical protein